jgi:hypothetical protein
VCRKIFSKILKITNFSGLALKKGLEIQFLNDFLMNLTKKFFWYVARILVDPKVCRQPKKLGIH